MKLHNSLSRKPETLVPLKGNAIRIYSCGPTVYGHIHIGNLSSFIFADTLRRVIAASGLEVEHVMNITDIDDKTIDRSRKEYPKEDALKALLKLTENYTKVFLKDMKRIGNDVGSVSFIKASATIPEIQALIRKLHAHGFAYIASDGVYFSISKYKAAGRTYGQLLDLTASSTSSARIDNDEYDKESAHDFALWKLQKDGEPAWDFQLGGEKLVGRPGWHIECSAMSNKTLGQPFDIHTGGIDLIFPHHENEIAQSTASEDDPVLASLFVHNEHILIDGRKMSKSLGNFYTLDDIEQKGYEPLVFRLMMLQSHFQSQTNFTWDSLEAARARLLGLKSMADLRFQPNSNGADVSAVQTARNKIQTALENNLSTPQALAYLSELSSQLEAEGISKDAISEFNKFILWLDDVLGLQLGDNKDINPAEKQLIIERQAARAASNWDLSDSIRANLTKRRLSVRDTPEGPIWSRL